MRDDRAHGGGKERLRRPGESYSMILRLNRTLRRYSRSVVGERGLRPSTWHGFLLQYLSHVLRRENERRPRMMMRRRGRRGHTRAVQLTSPVALEFHGASSPRGGAGTTPGTESEPWRPPSTHDRGAGQETAPLVGPRGEAVGSLLGQQASSFALPLSAGSFLVVPSPVSPSRLREGLRRLPLRQSGCARCRPVLAALGPRMNRRRRDAAGRYSATATHQRPLAELTGLRRPWTGLRAGRADRVPVHMRPDAPATSRRLRART